MSPLRVWVVAKAAVAKSRVFAFPNWRAYQKGYRRQRHLLPIGLLWWLELKDLTILYLCFTIPPNMFSVALICCRMVMAMVSKFPDCEMKSMAFLVASVKALKSFWVLFGHQIHHLQNRCCPLELLHRAVFRKRILAFGADQRLRLKFRSNRTLQFVFGHFQSF